MGIEDGRRRSSQAWKIKLTALIYTVTNLRVVVLSAPTPPAPARTKYSLPSVADSPRVGGEIPEPSASNTEKSSAAVSDVAISSDAPRGKNVNYGQGSIQFLFSDVDGTLVHYPVDATNTEGGEDGETVLHLPPSSTGMRGVISSETLKLCRRLRCELGVKIILVSGMRTTTMMKRMQYLPRADAYACEGGGRIFYPVKLAGREDYDGLVIRPRRFDGASDSDLTPFGITEDMYWRGTMESAEAAGRDGYISDGSDSIGGSLISRKGALWSFARSLQLKGYVIDSKDYASCFRVNRKQQIDEVLRNEGFERLLSTDVPEGLASSVNLGCIDFYPCISGKKNW